MNETFEELLAKCRTGDDEAIRRLVARFQPWARDYASAMLKDASLAEDAVQEGFVTALQRLPSLREAEAFPGWFRQIVRTQVNRIQRNRRETTGLDSNLLQSRAPSPREALERNELFHRIRAALAALPEKGRETAELFYLEERSCSETADILRVPKGTVKRRLHDARLRLRSMLLYSRDVTIEDAEETRKPGGGLPL